MSEGIGKYMAVLADAIRSKQNIDKAIADYTDAILAESFIRMRSSFERLNGQTAMSHADVSRVTPVTKESQRALTPAEERLSVVTQELDQARAALLLAKKQISVLVSERDDLAARMDAIRVVCDPTR